MRDEIEKGDSDRIGGGVRKGNIERFFGGFFSFLFSLSLSIYQSLCIWSGSSNSLSLSRSNFLSLSLCPFSKAFDLCCL